MEASAKKDWQDKVKQEIPKIENVLAKLGYALDDIQPNLIGEKFLMKTEVFVLVGVRTSDNKRVILKVSATKSGKKEIAREKKTTESLKSLALSNNSIRVSEEYFYGTEGGYTILANEFLDQKEVFTKLPLEEQFFIALRAFDILESFYISTREHKKQIKGRFPILSERDYLQRFSGYKKSIDKLVNTPEMGESLDEAFGLFKKNRKVLGMFSPYMVHEDFVPHNFRIQNNVLYIIDHEAILFGNKHESWARFLNFMLAHNPRLEEKLREYVRNKGENEYLSLRMMRLLKCTQLMDYYARTIEKSDGNLLELNKKRLSFWKNALDHLMDDSPLHESLVQEFSREKDALRSPEEKERQKMLKHTDR